MKQNRDIMGMPVALEITDAIVKQEYFDKVFDYFVHIDQKFSTYKNESEISRINRGELSPAEYSDEMKIVFDLSEETKKMTGGYFDIRKADGTYDPSGLVKGWAINNGALILKNLGCKNFYVDIGGDIQVNGKNGQSEEWSIGIRNPFNREEIIKVIYPRGQGVATSGTYIRGDHILDPFSKKAVESDIISLTVIGPNIYEADRFATAAFAMGSEAIQFIENLEGFEGYAVNKNGIATMTSGFEHYTKL